MPVFPIGGQRPRERKRYGIYRTIEDTIINILKVFGLEVVRTGFKEIWQERDYDTLIAATCKIPGRISPGRSQAPHVVRPGDDTHGRKLSHGWTLIYTD